MTPHLTPAPQQLGGDGRKDSGSLLVWWPLQVLCCVGHAWEAGGGSRLIAVTVGARGHFVVNVIVIVIAIHSQPPIH